MSYFLTHPDVLVWAILFVSFIVAECMTSGLVSIWFAIGALIGIFIAVMNLPIWLQVLVFLVVSGILLLITLPLAERTVNKKTVRTNADRVIGMKGVITEEVNSLSADGRVNVLGQSWRACCSDDTTLAVGSVIVVKAIEGAKLIVEPFCENND